VACTLSCIGTIAHIFGGACLFAGAVWGLVTVPFLARRLWSVAVILWLLAALLVGCARVEVEDGLAGTMTPAPAIERAGEAASVRVLAIDFDPPLSSLTFPFASTGLMLLVAVENTGLETQSNVIVRVELWQGARDEDPLGSRSVVLPLIAAGEVRVIRFAGMEGLGPASAYWLKVSATALGDGDASTGSERLYRIRLGQEP
jgi:hypothetical protein